jgi:hypothetical protein
MSALAVAAPSLMFFTNDHVMWCSNLLLCTILAFYTVSFASITTKVSHTVAWNIIFFCLVICKHLIFEQPSSVFYSSPVVLIICSPGSAFFQAYTVHKSSLIAAFSKLDAEVIAQVIEEEEETNNIATLLRQKLRNKLSNAISASGENAQDAQVHFIVNSCSVFINV